jgi:hypothetical protein
MSESITPNLDKVFGPTVKPDYAPIDLASGRFVNETAIKQHALNCSKQFRAGRFTRVGQDFMDEVKADVEQLVRELRKKYPLVMHEELPQDLNFTTGALLGRVQNEVEHCIARIIQSKVQRQPSCGVTLGRTR